MGGSGYGIRFAADRVERQLEIDGAAAYIVRRPNGERLAIDHRDAVKGLRHDEFDDEIPMDLTIS